jgi:hypothetical protein
MGLYNVESNISYGRDQQTQNLQTKSTIFCISSMSYYTHHFNPDDMGNSQKRYQISYQN